MKSSEGSSLRWFLARGWDRAQRRARRGQRRSAHARVGAFVQESVGVQTATIEQLQTSNHAEHAKHER